MTTAGMVLAHSAWAKRGHERRFTLSLRDTVAWVDQVISQLTGAALTYASIGQASAPGQLEVSAVREVLGIVQRGAQG
ncbi:type I 3-dehydroquinate dehydratase [Pseudomonas entomophila]|uniref:type I 3-dehydroquinate dehydratase n=1 Tax=Pseudomonas entomophila TaxID=312306 RepID=UPI0015E3A5FC|nr:type I 3-dehydroquinate dehydratase [Pseudomonas entomophila]MBA1189632.1 type I 3-dehydroquinate dehydratase [Pseudomonas entomophila]